MSEINGRQIPEDKEIVFEKIDAKVQRKEHYVDECVKHPAIILANNLEYTPNIF